MFAYLSLLVEQGHFDEIRVNFFIVGHTHAPIDQYFSVFGIYSTNVKTHYLIDKFLLNKYDYVSYFSPIIKKNLQYYGLPHVFVFKRRCGRCICQHKSYTRSPQFFPIEPIHQPKTSEEVVLNSRAFSIEPLSFIGGIDHA